MPGLSGVLSLPFRRQGRLNPSSLPTYERLSSPTKERFSEDYDSDYSDVDDLDSFPSSHSSTPSSGGSRHTSLSASSSAMMLPRKRPTARQRVRRIYPYRLPSRSARCLAVVIVVSLVTMAVTLVRASQVDNMRIAEGGYKRPPPPSAPQAWERFPLLSRYYGGLRTLVPLDQNEPEYPLPEDVAPPPAAGQQQQRRELPSSKAFASEHPGSVFVESPEEMNACFLDVENTVAVPAIRYYDGRPSGFPDHVLGSYEDLSLPGDICFDRFGRYGPYGLGYSVRQGGVGRGDIGDTEGASAVWADTPQVDYRRVDWADAQRRCYHANVDRFQPAPARSAGPHGFYIGESPLAAADNREDASEGALAETKPSDATESKPRSDTGLQAMSRTAVVLRCWDEMEWQVDEVMFVRSLISELSLASGGRYDVHILVQVKDEGKNPIWADSDAYERVIRDRIPREFRGLVTLWTQTQMLALYQGIYDLYPKGPGLPVHGAYRGLQMAMQHFAHEHAEYEQFWQWEMDIRYTGHYYDFFTKVEGWAREQPRRGLWERGERFYVPSVHGAWEDFKQTTALQTEGGGPPTTNTAAAEGRKGFPGIVGGLGGGNTAPKPIWGPERPADEADWFEPRKDPQPDAETPEQDAAYAWGVGEEADLITFNPMFDPEGTTWGLADDITGYNTTGARPPRRAHISTASRMSRRLLTTMHRQTALKKQFAFSEMWPATVALQHGYKAVYAPHPEFVDRRWPAGYLAGVLNGGRVGASGGARTSVFGLGEHNMHGLSWFYRSDFAAELYKAWMGLASRHTSGEEFELGGDKSRDGVGVEGMRGGEGRMCLPPMLLHPIKNLGMVVEAPPDEQMVEPEEDPEFDPGS